MKSKVRRGAPFSHLFWKAWSECWVRWFFKYFPNKSKALIRSISLKVETFIWWPSTDHRPFEDDRRFCWHNQGVRVSAWTSSKCACQLFNPGVGAEARHLLREEEDWSSAFNYPQGQELYSVGATQFFLNSYLLWVESDLAVVISLLTRVTKLSLKSRF